LPTVLAQRPSAAQPSWLSGPTVKLSGPRPGPVRPTTQLGLSTTLLRLSTTLLRLSKAQLGRFNYPVRAVQLPSSGGSTVPGSRVRRHVRCAQAFGGNFGVHLGGADGDVAEQLLDGPYVRSVLEHVRCAAMA